MTGHYDTPQAFRAALQAGCETWPASETPICSACSGAWLSSGCWLDCLRGKTRVPLGQDPPWLLKGGYALELRLPNRARPTLDLDLSVPEPERLLSPPVGDEPARRDAEIHEQLQIAAERELDDGFQFLVRLPKRAASLAAAFAAASRLAWRAGPLPDSTWTWALATRCSTRWVAGSDLLDFAGIPAAQVALYPVAQQFAERIHAYTFPWQDRDNTRVKDMVDLVLLIHTGQVEPKRVRRALRATFAMRASHPLPFQLPEPPQDWAEPYAALARELDLPAATLSQAYDCLVSYWAKWELFAVRAPDAEKDIE